MGFFNRLFSRKKKAGGGISSSTQNEGTLTQDSEKNKFIDTSRSYPFLKESPSDNSKPAKSSKLSDCVCDDDILDEGPSMKIPEFGETHRKCEEKKIAPSFSSSSLRSLESPRGLSPRLRNKSSLRESKKGDFNKKERGLASSSQFSVKSPRRKISRNSNIYEQYDDKAAETLQIENSTLLIQLKTSETTQKQASNYGWGLKPQGDGSENNMKPICFKLTFK